MPYSSAALPYRSVMIKVHILSCWRRTGLSALAGLTLCLQDPLVAAQNLFDGPTTDNVAVDSQIQPVALEQRAQVTYDTYILGPGDGLQIELLDLPELSGRFSIGPRRHPCIYRASAPSMWRASPWRSCVRSSRSNSAPMLDPQIYIRPVAYRPIRVYVGG